jgi:hypothetical protein
MSIELPALSAVIARLQDPEINLAAYGGVVFPLSLIIESPIIMLLAASTALSKDWKSFCLVRRYMMTAGVILTSLHIVVAFTPFYYVVVNNLLGVPKEIVEPARIGLMIMTPWSWSIAYRRFHQGVLIRFGQSKTVGKGTIIRLVADLTLLVIGYLVGTIPGIVVSTSAVASGVVSEAAYVGFVTRPVLQHRLMPAPSIEKPLTWRAFWAFYIPLMMTSLLMLLANPIGSAAISRMPKALDSLAAWSVVTGLIFLIRSLGIAYNEVVVALLEEVGFYANLKRFAEILSVTTTLVLFLIAATPLSILWFDRISALSPELAELARRSLWFALPLPALSVLQSWYQGTILYRQRTRGITESMIIYLLISIFILGAGVWWGKATGLYVGLIALSLSVFFQTIWLGFRSIPARREIRSHDIQS